MVPSGTGVLYFVIVARLTLLKETKLSVQALQPIEDMLRKLGLGGECGYGVLQDRCTVLLFDIARSPAWFVNSDAHITSWLPGQRPQKKSRAVNFTQGGEQMAGMVPQQG